SGYPARASMRHNWPAPKTPTLILGLLPMFRLSHWLYEQVGYGCPGMRWKALPDLLIQLWAPTLLVFWIRIVQYRLCLCCPVRINCFAYALVKRTNDLCGQQAGIGGTGLSNSQSADGNAAGHLDDGQQRVQSVQCF